MFDSSAQRINSRATSGKVRLRGLHYHIVVAEGRLCLIVAREFIRWARGAERLVGTNGTRPASTHSSRENE